MPVATITYNYNVRSWVTGISSSYFNQHLFYNESNGSNQPAYNGNISATSWNKGEPHDRAYNFYYDRLSRLTSANYSGLGKEDYTTAYSYYKHGNMLTLTRQGRRS